MKKFSLIAFLGLLSFGLFSFTNTEEGEMVRYTIVQHVGFNVTIHDTIIDLASGFTMEDYISELGLNAEDIEIINTSNSDAQFVSSDTDIWFFNQENSEDGMNFSTFEMNISDDMPEGTQIIMIEQSEESCEEIEGEKVKTVQAKKVVISDDPNMEIDNDFTTITIDAEAGEGESTEMTVEVEIDEEGNEIIHVFVNGEEVDPANFEGNINILNSGDAEVMMFSETDTNPDHNFTIGIISPMEDENKSVVTSDSSIQDIKFHPLDDQTFNLSFNNTTNEKTEIKVYDINGRVIFHDDLGNFEGEYSNNITLPGVSQGTYILNIIQNGIPTVKKMLLK